MPLNSARLSPVRTRRHDRERLGENPTQYVARTQAASRQAKNSVEFPTRLMHFERQLFNQVVILVVANVQVLTVFCQHASLQNLFKRTVIEQRMGYASKSCDPGQG